MANNKNKIKEEILKLYQIDTNDKGIKDNIYKNLDRLRKKHFNKKWEELHPLEIVEFKYITIKDTMFKNYIDLNKKRQVEKIINKHISNYINPKIKNLHLEHLHEIFYNSDISDEENKQNYELQKKYSEAINPETLTYFPTFDKWLKDSKNGQPLKIYDLQQTIHDELNQEIQSSTHSYPDQTFIKLKTLETAVHCINRVLEDKYNLTVDLQEIEKAHTHLYNDPFDNSEARLLEVDPTLKIPEAEQQEIIKNEFLSIEYRTKLEKLDFITTTRDEN